MGRIGTKNQGKITIAMIPKRDSDENPFAENKELYMYFHLLLGHCNQMLINMGKKVPAVRK